MLSSHFLRPIILASLLMTGQRTTLGNDEAPQPKKADQILTTSGYRRPPQEITDILNAQPTPSVSLSPTREYLLLIERSSYPPIEDLAAPMLRLAGYRINPLTNGPHLAPRSIGLLLQSIATGEQRRIEVPVGAIVGQLLEPRP